MKCGTIPAPDGAACDVCGAPAMVEGSVSFVTFAGAREAVVVCPEHLALWRANEPTDDRS